MPKRTRSSTKTEEAPPTPKTPGRKKRKSSLAPIEDDDEVLNGKNLEGTPDDIVKPEEDERIEEVNERELEATDPQNTENESLVDSPAKLKTYDGSQEYDADSPTKTDENPDNLEQVSEDENVEQDTLEQDTEMVSEDELPTEISKPPLVGTEAVSDEELPNMVTDNLDTEAVSDDELPQDERRKRKANKVQESAIMDQEQDVEDPKMKNLPELEKYWKAVKEDPTDFTGWTYLLQYVDQENDVEAAREAYDSFLSHYPYCYGYWRKYADYEKRKGNQSRCEEVFERGLKAIPLSVDLWLHFLNYCKMSMKDHEDQIRDQYERAIEICGLEFRSDRLWESYIKWETDLKNLQNVIALYDRLISTPTQNYTTHFENFEGFIMNNHPSKYLSEEDYAEFQAEAIEKIKEKSSEEKPPPPSTAEGEEGEDKKSPPPPDEETTLIQEKIISSKKKVFKATVSCVLSRWNYEEGIKRPYFHVKPLERCQLNNWRDYLDYEIEQGDETRTVILFERCLIACALYDEYWVKFIKYLESLPGDHTEQIRDVYERACTIHHPKKPILSLNWSLFEETLGNIEKAKQVLIRLEKEVPNLIQVCSRRINLERRAGNLDGAKDLYERYINTVKSKSAVSTLVLKYARFCWKVLKSPERGIEILRNAVEKDKDNTRYYLQMLDLTLNKPYLDECEFLSIINQVLNNENIDIESKTLFAQRKLEFLEDFGSSIEGLQKASVEYLSYCKQTKEKKKKLLETEKAKSEEKRKDTQSTTATTSAASTAATNSYSAAYTQASTSGYPTATQNGQYTQAGNYNAQFNQYSGSDQTYNNYSGWGYSQTQYGNYNQGWAGYNYYS